MCVQFGSVHFWTTLFTRSYRGLPDGDVVDVHSVDGLSGPQQQHAQVVSHQHRGVVEDPIFSE